MANSVTRWQIVAHDPERVAAFYSNLFGWKVNAANALGYRELISGQPHGIDGGVWPNAPGSPNLVQLFVEVDDLDAHVVRAEKSGARVIVPPSQLPDGDRMAILLDVAGLSFGIFTPGRK